ncbi:hypothetical protein LJC55_00075 [Eubacteriales bacterium OttesenSCG-928-N14]|nr:hypothetical protein [Eubacteriales bacterium OttesenSCG-928-N14]
MALLCMYGGECLGCMRCQGEIHYICPVCNAMLGAYATVYTAVNGDVLGCDECVDVSLAECTKGLERLE